MKYACILALLVIVGCKTVVHGHITRKFTEPPGVVYIPVTTCSTSGKSTSCITTNIPIFYDESYGIEVDGVDKHRKAAHDTLWLSKTEYEHTNIGDIYECGQKIECKEDRPQ